MGKAIIVATTVAGALDILFAAVMTLLNGREPAAMLRSVASGPIPGASQWGTAGSFLGLFVHFALMAVMAAAFVLAARQRPALLAKPYRSGIAYGVVTYFVMNWLVVPLRFGTPLPPEPRAIATQLFAHIVLVGIPIALIAARRLRPRLA